ncbi:hypothetical protein LPB136_12130 [Tenacibaculum todarodis]|uniref:GLPGLI family protein n=1 Tax=Tenacibaculum todarodis TaxID=1850252 RepID=A0A1L3JLP2_9FLAO|nr:GLPGLI family protein [Tenacibaculum todarodis]APG66070.1 hypothetical protein LPB136_12130 [Tenacibaculum todarodis]
MKIKILILIYVFYSSIVFSQKKGVVIYNVKIDTTGFDKKTKDQNKQAVKLIKSITNNSKNYKLKLSFKDDNSYYSLINKGLNTDSESNYKLNLSKIMFKIRSKFYYKIKDNYILEEKEFLGDIFLVKKNKKISDWKLLNVKKKIGKYICYKAERDYVYESRKGKVTQKQIVWYTTEIPLPFGPKEFVGFPGLVLKVQAGKIIYTAEKITLNPKGKITIKKPLKGKMITEKELQNLGKKAMGEFTRN